MEGVLNPPGGGAGGDQPMVLVSFQAGKLEREGSTVTADPRRGVFQIVVTPEDMLTHLHWRPKGSASPEIDLIIFPGEAEFVPVSSSPDRVFVLKWREGSERKFFWMQGRDQDQDHTVVESVNQILSDGPTAAQDTRAVDPSRPQSGPSNPSPSPPPDRPTDGTPVGAKAANAHASPMSTGPQQSSAAPAVTLTALQNAMASTAAAISQSTPTLGELLHPDNVRTVLESPEMAESIPELSKHLPQGESVADASAVLELLRSPALRSQIGSLTQALASGAAADLIASFGLADDAGTPPTAVGAAGLQAFFAALRRVPRKEG